MSGHSGWTLYRLAITDITEARELARDIYAHSALAGSEGAFADHVRSKLTEWGMANESDDARGNGGQAEAPAAVTGAVAIEGRGTAVCEGRQVGAVPGGLTR